MKPLRQLSFAVVALAVALGINYASAAWSNPSTPPPGGNIDVPINVGNTDQSKIGGINTYALKSALKGGVFNFFADSATGRVGIGPNNNAPGALLDVYDGTNHTQLTGNNINFTRASNPAYVWATGTGGYLDLGTNGRATSNANANLVLNADQTSTFNGEVTVPSLNITGASGYKQLFKAFYPNGQVSCSFSAQGGIHTGYARIASDGSVQGRLTLGGNDTGWVALSASNVGEGTYYFTSKDFAIGSHIVDGLKVDLGGMHIYLYPASDPTTITASGCTATW